MDKLLGSIQNVAQDAISAISRVFHTTEDSEFPTPTHLYYAIARSLYRGYDPNNAPTTPGSSPFRHYARRSPLPMELVILIFAFSGVTKLEPTLTLTTRLSSLIQVDTHGPQCDVVIMHTEPMTQHLLDRLRRVQLITLSRDQGWVSDKKAGSWSWFELAIFEPVEKVQSETSTPNRAHPDARMFDRDIYVTYSDPPEGEEDADPVKREYKIKRRRTDSIDEEAKLLRWKSHNNALASREPDVYRGKSFDSDEEIWRYLDVGDIIVAYACVCFGGWANVVHKAELLFWERFDPAGLAV